MELSVSLCKYMHNICTQMHIVNEYFKMEVYFSLILFLYFYLSPTFSIYINLQFTCKNSKALICNMSSTLVTEKTKKEKK